MRSIRDKKLGELVRKVDCKILHTLKKGYWGRKLNSYPVPLFYYEQIDFII